MATTLPLPVEWWYISYALFLLSRSYLDTRSDPFTPLVLTNLISDRKIKSDLVAVTASNFISRFVDNPVRFSELQFSELTAKAGHSTAPVAVNYCKVYSYRGAVEV